MKHIACVLVAFLLSSPAAAQKSAEELFVEAGQAFEAGDLGLAQRLLSESLTLSPQSATALNLGRVHLQRGDPTQALGIADDLLAAKYGVLSEDRTQAVETLHAKATKQVGHLKVIVKSDFSAINLDGRSFVTKRGDLLSLPVNPGSHVLVGSCARESSLCGSDVSKTFDVQAGNTVSLSLKATPKALVPIRKDTKEESSSRSFFRTPWPYVIGAIVIAGAVLVALWARGNFDSSPENDPTGTYPVVTAHTASW